MTSASLYTRQPRESFLGIGNRPRFSQRLMVKMLRSSRSARSLILYTRADIYQIRLHPHHKIGDIGASAVPVYVTLLYMSRKKSVKMLKTKRVGRFPSRPGRRQSSLLCSSDRAIETNAGYRRSPRRRYGDTRRLSIRRQVQEGRVLSTYSHRCNHQEKG